MTVSEGTFGEPKKRSFKEKLGRLLGKILKKAAPIILDAAIAEARARTDPKGGTYTKPGSVVKK